MLKQPFQCFLPFPRTGGTHRNAHFFYVLLYVVHVSSFFETRFFDFKHIYGIIQYFLIVHNFHKHYFPKRRSLTPIKFHIFVIITFSPLWANFLTFDKLCVILQCLWHVCEFYSHVPHILTTIWSSNYNLSYHKSIIFVILSIFLRIPRNFAI